MSTVRGCGLAKKPSRKARQLCVELRQAVAGVAEEERQAHLLVVEMQPMHAGVSAGQCQQIT